MATTGRTTIEETPLNLRTSGIDVDDDLREVVEKRLTRKLGKFAYHVTRVTVRFRDVNGPRGGTDSECAIKVVLAGAPSLVARKRAADARVAFDEAAKVIERAVRKDLDKRGWSGPAKAGASAGARSRQSAREVVNPPPAGGALIGRRVGQSRADVRDAAARPEKRRRDVYVDTAAPGVSATDRKAGGGSTARRNTQLRPRTAVAALEDSATGTPSRKSTRRAQGRAKRDDPQRLAQGRKVASPRFRAAKSRAKRKR